MIDIFVWHPSATQILEKCGYKSGEIEGNLEDALEIVKKLVTNGLTIALKIQQNGNIVLLVDTKLFQQR